MLPVIHTQTLEAATTLGLLPQTIAAWVAGSVGTIGAAPRGVRALRPDGVLGGAADARDRDPHGARLVTRGRALAGPAAGRTAGDDRRDDRHRARDRGAACCSRACSSVWRRSIRWRSVPPCRSSPASRSPHRWSRRGAPRAWTRCARSAPNRSRSSRDETPIIGDRWSSFVQWRRSRVLARPTWHDWYVDCRHAVH